MADENQPVPSEKAPESPKPAPSASLDESRRAGGTPPAQPTGEPTPPTEGGSKTLTIILVVILVIAVAVAGYMYYRSTQSSEESEATATTTATIVSSPSTLETVTASPIASTQPTATEQQPIVVTGPVANQLVTSPVVITGSAIAFENTIYARIKDSNGQILGTVTITTEASDVGLPGKYSASLTFSSPTTNTGTIEVYETDAATGEDKNIVTIQVRFK